MRMNYLLITLVLCVPAVLLSHSRTGVLGVAFMIGTLSFIVFPPKYVIRIFMVLGFGGMVVLGGLTYLQSVSENSGSAQIEKRTNQLFDLLQGKIESETTGGRSDLAKMSFRLIAKQPLVGHGLGFMNKLPGQRVGPHNMVLKVLGDSGVFGAFGLVVFAFIFLSTAAQCKIHWIKVGLLGIILAIFFNLMSTHDGLSRRFIIFQLAFLISFAEQRVCLLYTSPSPRDRG